MGIMAALIAMLFLPFISCPADAYHSRHAGNASHYKHSHRLLTRSECNLTNNGQQICNTIAEPPALNVIGNRTFAMADSGTIIGSRPGGCPHS